MEYPELEKMEIVQTQSQVIGEFLDWLQDEKEVWLMQRVDHDGRGRDIVFHYSTEKLLAEFFNIDLKKIEKEKRQILEQIKQPETNP